MRSRELRSRNWIWRLAVAALAVLALAGCSTYATPDTSSIGLAYTGGSYDDKYFEKCVPAGGNTAIDNGGDTAYYPQGTRTWAFGVAGGDGPAIGVSTKNMELATSGLITFTLDTSCTAWNDGKDGVGGKDWPGGKIQKFHETIGRSKAAAFPSGDSTQVPQGWKDVLAVYLGGPADRVMDTTAGDYTWQELYTQPAKVTAFTDKVAKDLPDKIKDATGGDSFFNIISVQINKPALPGPLLDEMNRKQQELQAQETEEQKRAFIASWPGGPAGYQAFQAQQETDARILCLSQGRCPVVVPNSQLVPAGGS